jgi:hypothetical protein
MDPGDPVRANLRKQLEALELIRANLKAGKKIADDAQLLEWSMAVLDPALARAEQEITELQHALDSRSG